MKTLLAASVLIPLSFAISAPVAVDLPEGFTAEVAATAPMVRHPIMATLGERGSLFVGDAAGVNLDRKGLEEQLPNRILLLQDTNGDGTYDTSTVFADRMTFPQGGVWLNGSLYVASPPGIWKLTDHNGDGVSDEREMIVGGFDFTGNAADVHGPFLHPNGRLYWCHGRKGHDVKQRDGTPVHAGLASGIWSCRPDGSDIRWHALGSADNPVEIDFTPEGEIVGTVNLSFTNPRGDTIMHWLHGGVYPRQDQLGAVAGLPRTLDTMPVVHNFGHVAVSGCMFYRSGALEPAWRGNLFVTHFNTRRVTRMEMIPDGATYRTVEREFLRLHNPDAHITDVLEDRDGSLLVVDTGGWFRNGCPSSLMAKPDITGRIYRVRKTGAANRVEPWGAATAKVWEHARRNGPEDVRELAKLLASGDSSVAQAAGNALASVASAEATEALLTALRHSNPSVQLAAAHAIGTLPQQSTATVDACLDGLRSELDPSVEHQLMHTLLLAKQAAPLLKALHDSSNPKLQRRSLTILSQLPGSAISEEDMLPLLDSADEALAKKAIDVIHARPEWLTAATAHLGGWLERESIAPARLALLEHALTPWMKEAAVRELVTRLLEGSSPDRRSAGLRLIAASTPQAANPRWTAALQKALHGAAPSELPLVLEACARISDSQIRTAIQQLADDGKLPLPLRMKALSASSKAGSALSPDAFALLARTLADPATGSGRMEAAQIVARSKLSKEQLLQVGPILAELGPVELREILKVIRQSKETEVAHAFANALKDAPALGSLPESEIRTTFSSFPPEVFDVMAPSLQALAAADGARRRKLDSWPALAASKGRAAEGQTAFEAGKGACIACHRVGDKGGIVGPDLSRIGQIRNERDLIESILFPSSSLARDYEAQVVETASGQSYTGVIRENTHEAVVLTDPSGQQHRVAREQIISMHPAPESLMPSGLDLTLSEQELFDLVAYLRSRK